jgi:hypothetical protein
MWRLRHNTFPEPPQPMNEDSCDAFSLRAGHRIELVL